MLDRIFSEHLAHNRYQNGRLPVTYADFENVGVQRKYIRSSIDELVALGLVEETFTGRKRFGDLPGRPSLYRITWIGTISQKGGTSPPTDEWRSIQTSEQAEERVKSAKEMRSQKNSTALVKRRNVGCQRSTTDRLSNDNH
ncbi:MAG: hypothetical protein Q8M31_00265 [Beijerinckiaceae bacterium]|nr:hypothetical protein [Beijerinckiaceae bacterium]